MTKPREGPRFVRTIMLVTEGAFGGGGGGQEIKLKGESVLMLRRWLNSYRLSNKCEAKSVLIPLLSPSLLRFRGF